MKKLSIISLVFVISLMVSSLLGCQQDLKGSLSIGGSTTVQPIAQKMADVFNEKHPNVVISINCKGSGDGITGANNGTFDIGASSRELKSDEPALRKYLIGRDGIAIVVHPSNSVKELTKQQIIDIFSGKITNWKEVGGNDQAISVVTRESNSGTLGAFNELVMGKTAISSGATVEPGNSEVRAFVSINPASIGFLSVGLVDSTVRAVVVDGVECTIDSCKSGKYPVMRPLYFLTSAEPMGVVKAYLDYALSSEGQNIVVGEGYISAK